MRRRWDVIDVTFAGFVVALVLLLIGEVGATGPKIVVKPPCPKYQPVPQAQPTTDEQVLEARDTPTALGSQPNGTGRSRTGGRGTKPREETP